MGLSDQMDSSMVYTRDYVTPQTFGLGNEPPTYVVRPEPDEFQLVPRC